MNWKQEYKYFLWTAGLFIMVYFMPLGQTGFDNAIFESLALLKWYAREHVLFCLIPAFFIAGVIAVFVSQGAVLKYFGAAAKKWVSYLVASVSGSILAVCSCTILPLFAGIYKRGAGLGPAVTFLYAGPAINIMALILTARILGFEIGLARIIGATVFAIVIGLVMSRIYRSEEMEKSQAQMEMPVVEESRPFWQTSAHFFVLVGILIFATWGAPESESGIWSEIYSIKWIITSFFGILLVISLIFILKIKALHVFLAIIPVLSLIFIFPGSTHLPFLAAIISLSVLLTLTDGEPSEWFESSWGFARQIIPLLAAGVLVAGFLFGSPEGQGGIIPATWISGLVGGNSLFANFMASVVGAFMYFATLTEIPILQGLMHSGMGKGPALALLLAGPALSLPNMLVIRSVMGTKKTVVFVVLVVVMATISGVIYGHFF
jgi:uncharacterized membrane protein YraQ (UPF0718 family)